MQMSSYIRTYVRRATGRTELGTRAAYFGRTADRDDLPERRRERDWQPGLATGTHCHQRSAEVRVVAAPRLAIVSPVIQAQAEPAVSLPARARYRPFMPIGTAIGERLPSASRATVWLSPRCRPAAAVAAQSRAPAVGAAGRVPALPGPPGAATARGPARPEAWRCAASVAASTSWLVPPPRRCPGNTTLPGGSASSFMPGQRRGVHLDAPRDRLPSVSRQASAHPATQPSDQRQGVSRGRVVRRVPPRRRAAARRAGGAAHSAPLTHAVRRDKIAHRSMPRRGRATVDTSTAALCDLAPEVYIGRRWETITLCLVQDEIPTEYLNNH